MGFGISMVFEFTDTGEAASVFLALYVVYLATAVYILYCKKGFNNPYTTLTVYGLIRVAGQICGVGFALEGDKHLDWLIAYMILGAEGYFTLVLSSMYMLIGQQRKYLGYSALKDKVYGPSWGKYGFFVFRPKSIKSWFHMVLIVANALLITGSSMLAGMSSEEIKEEHHEVVIFRALRTTGQAIFLAFSLCISGLTVHYYKYKKMRSKVMTILVVVIPFLTIRGIFGALSIHITRMNYMEVSNYVIAANHRTMTIYEYVLNTSMEFITGSLLLNTYWLDREGTNEASSGQDEGTKEEVMVSGSYREEHSTEKSV